MKRKLIKQGASGLTICLPKKWTDKHELKAGEELDLQEFEDTLILSSKEIKKDKKNIELKLESGRESKIRTPVLSAYRAGFDKITIDYTGHEKEIQNIVTNFMVGFEVFNPGQNKYVVESVAETNYEDFDKIVQKMFFVLLEILNNIESKDTDHHFIQLQKYDHLLKRLLSKNVLTVKASFSFWHFLSNLTQSARQANHLQELHTRKFNIAEKDILNDSIEMLKTLQKAYLTKDLNLLFRLHDIESRVNKKSLVLLKKGDAIYTHYLLDICRQIYINSSTLTSIIQSELF